MIRANVKKEDRQLHVGILGCSAISQAAHLRAASTARNVELTAICDSSKDLGWKMAAIYEPKKIYPTYREMLDDPDVDAIIIGVPDRFHADSALQAVLAHKHVLVEQPMGLTVEECETLMDVGHRLHQVVQVGSLRRFDSGIRFARDYIRKNFKNIVSFHGWLCESSDLSVVEENLQPILYSNRAAIRTLYGTDAQNILYQQGTMMFDTAIFLCGPIREISARTASTGDIQSWAITLQFESGVLGTLHLEQNIRAERREGFEIFSSEGSIFGTCYSPWQFQTTQVTCRLAGKNELITPYDPDGQFFRRQLESFADVILAEKKMPQTGAGLNEGIHVLKAILATIESAAQNGRPVLLSEVFS